MMLRVWLRAAMYNPLISLNRVVASSGLRVVRLVIRKALILFNRAVACGARGLCPPYPLALRSRLKAACGRLWRL